MFDSDRHEGPNLLISTNTTILAFVSVDIYLQFTQMIYRK